MCHHRAAEGLGGGTRSGSGQSTRVPALPGFTALPDLWGLRSPANAFLQLMAPEIRQAGHALARPKATISILFCKPLCPLSLAACVAAAPAFLASGVETKGLRTARPRRGPSRPATSWGPQRDLAPARLRRTQREKRVPEAGSAGSPTRLGSPASSPLLETPPRLLGHLILPSGTAWLEEGGQQLSSAPHPTRGHEPERPNPSGDFRLRRGFNRRGT